MSEMVERATRAARDEMRRLDMIVGEDDKSGAFIVDYVFGQDTLELLIRAAIEALHEPTEDIIHAGAVIGGPECSHSDALAIWHAMIDAALTK